MLPPRRAKSNQRIRSSPSVYVSTNLTPELMRNKWRKVVAPYAVPVSRFSYCAAVSSSEAILPSCSAMPTAIDTIVFAMEFDRKRSSLVRSY